MQHSASSESTRFLLAQTVSVGSAWHPALGGKQSGLDDGRAKEGGSLFRRGKWLYPKE